MKTFPVSTLVSIVSLALIGCGGSSASPQPAPSQPSSVDFLEFLNAEGICAETAKTYWGKDLSDELGECNEKLSDVGALPIEDGAAKILLGLWNCPSLTQRGDEANQPIEETDMESLCKEVLFAERAYSGDGIGANDIVWGIVVSLVDLHFYTAAVAEKDPKKKEEKIDKHYEIGTTLAKGVLQLVHPIIREQAMREMQDESMRGYGNSATQDVDAGIANQADSPDE